MSLLNSYEAAKQLGIMRNSYYRRIRIGRLEGDLMVSKLILYVLYAL